jgi:hypothetical protein
MIVPGIIPGPPGITQVITMSKMQRQIILINEHRKSPEGLLAGT